jgi:transposase-like protein
MGWLLLLGWLALNVGFLVWILTRPAKCPSCFGHNVYVHGEGLRVFYCADCHRGFDNNWKERLRSY